MGLRPNPAVTHRPIPPSYASRNTIPSHFADGVVSGAGQGNSLVPRGIAPADGWRSRLCRRPSVDRR